MSTRTSKLRLARETVRHLVLKGQAQRLMRATPVILATGAALALVGCLPTNTCVCTIGH